jgi:YHS domain-containing protein
MRISSNSNTIQSSSMKKILFTLFLVSTLTAISCNNTAEQPAPAAETPAMAEPEAPKYTAEMVVNKTDFTCGMPTSAGISDTCHYEGKAYGFCSAECKAEFQKNPAAALASAK